MRNAKCNIGKMGFRSHIAYIGAVLLGMGLLLSSCVTSRKVNYMQEPDRRIPHYTDTLSFEDYELRKGDRLYIYVYSLDDKISQMYNSGMTNTNMRSQIGNSTSGSYDLYTYLVDDEGNIDYPTLGKIQVLGLTTRDVKHKLEEQLSTLLKELPGYQTISVEVNIVQRSFSIIGMQSGRYAIDKEKMTIFEALAMAGNIGEFGDRAQIKLVREKDGKTVIKTFDVRSKDIINSEFYYIEPNDIIYIRKMGGYQFGINSAATAVSVVASTISFGVFVYSLVQLGINAVDKAKAKSTSK